MSEDELKALHEVSSDRWLVTYGEWLIRWRWAVMAGALLLTLLVASGGRFLAFTTDYRVFFSPENPQLQAFEELQRVYTKADNVMFVITPEGGDPFAPEVLDAIEDLTERAWRIPYALRVDSVSNFQHTYAEYDDMIVEDLVYGGADFTPEEVEAAREVALSEPLLYGRLIAEDGRVTGVNVTFQLPEPDAEAVEGPDGQLVPPEMVTPMLIAPAVRELRDEIEAQYPFLEVRLSGVIMLNNSFSEVAQGDMTTLVPLMYLGILLMMWLLIRSLSAVLATLVVILFSVLTGMGAAGWLGIVLTPPSASAPTVIMTLAVADAVHIIITQMALMRDGLDKRLALIESLRLNFMPVLLTSVTTSIGFLTMNFSDAPPFRDLGNIVAIGVMAAWFWSVTLLPALLAICPLKPRASTSTYAHYMDRLGEFVVARRRGLLATMLVLGVVVVAGIPRNELNDEFVQYFDQTVEFRRDTDYAVENLTGIYLIQFSLPSGESNGVSDPQYLANLERFTSWLRAQPEVLHVSSFTDVMKRLNLNMHGDDPDWYRIPDSRELASQYLLLYELSLPYGLDLTNQVNIDKSATQLVVTLDDVSAVVMRDVAGRAEAWLGAETPGMFNHGISTGLMFAHISERNIESMLGGTLIGLVVISGILLIALRSVKIGILSLIPNLLPAGLAFGIWGLFVGRVDMAVSIVAGMTLGIVVDDTVHFLSKYLRARRERGYSSEQAVRYAFHTVGVALVVTTVILTAGFMLLAQSAFRVNASMAILTAIGIVMALIVDFLLLPPLLMYFDRGDRSEHSDKTDQKSIEETGDDAPAHA
jgi:uncharacterized protein